MSRTLESEPRGLEDQGPEARRLALILEYDGSNYAGFQLQAGQPTIQGEIEQGLGKFTGESVRIRGASRTDSGAHAKGQVVDFVTSSRHPVESFPRAMNYYLPWDVRVLKAYEVLWEFNSRRDALGRTYRYNILNREWPSPLLRNTRLWVKENLAIERMAAAAESLLGRHDFRVFSSGIPEDKSAVRQVRRWDVWKEGESKVVIEAESNGFLRHQIRRINAMLVEVGKGRLPEDSIYRVLRGDTPAEATLPAHGLCLVKVWYPGGWPDEEDREESWEVQGLASR